MSNFKKSINRAKETDTKHDAVERRIADAGFEVVARLPLPDGYGTQYRLFGGGVVNLYRTGTCLAQGRLSPEQKLKLKHALERH